MQATVAAFDVRTRTGGVLCDDGTPLPFGADAFAAGGLLLLRPGQRVNIALGDDGAVTAITLATFPLPG